MSVLSEADRLYEDALPDWATIVQKSTVAGHLVLPVEFQGTLQICQCLFSIGAQTTGDEGIKGCRRVRAALRSAVGFSEGRSASSAIR
jgi:hypothetical protein